MAIWQLSLYLVRRENVKLNYMDPEYLKSHIEKVREDFERLISWKGFQINERSVIRISQLLPWEKSWSSSKKQYGNLEDSCLELSYDKENMLLNVLLKLCVMNLYPELLMEIVEFTESNNCVLFHEKGIIEPTVKNLESAIKESTAYIFCKDPQGFLKKVQNKKERNEI